MTKKFKSLLLCLPFALVACSGVDTTNSSENKWKPVFIDGTDREHQARAKGAKAFIAFSSDSKFSGLAGDNLFEGTFDIDGDGKIEKSTLAKTNMNGINKEYETAFLAVINNAGHLNREGDKISIYSKEGKVLMQLVPLDSEELYKADAKLSEAEIAFSEKVENALPPKKLFDKTIFNWHPVYVSPVGDFRGERVPHIAISPDNTTMGGFAGENSFNCSFVLKEDGSAEVGTISSTKFKGRNSTYERAFISALSNTARVEQDGDTLTFFDKEDNVLVEFKPFDMEKAMGEMPVEPVVAEAEAQAIAIEENTQAEAEAKAKAEAQAEAEAKEKVQAQVQAEEKRMSKVKNEKEANSLEDLF